MNSAEHHIGMGPDDIHLMRWRVGKKPLAHDLGNVLSVMRCRLSNSLCHVHPRQVAERPARNDPDAVMAVSHSSSRPVCPIGPSGQTSHSPKHDPRIADGRTTHQQSRRSVDAVDSSRVSPRKDRSPPLIHLATGEWSRPRLEPSRNSQRLQLSPILPGHSDGNLREIPSAEIVGREPVESRLDCEMHTVKVVVLQTRDVRSLVSVHQLGRGQNCISDLIQFGIVPMERCQSGVVDHFGKVLDLLVAEQSKVLCDLWVQPIAGDLSSFQLVGEERVALFVFHLLARVWTSDEGPSQVTRSVLDRNRSSLAPVRRLEIGSDPRRNPRNVGNLDERCQRIVDLLALSDLESAGGSHSDAGANQPAGVSVLAQPTVGVSSLHPLCQMMAGVDELQEVALLVPNGPKTIDTVCFGIAPKGNGKLKIGPDLVDCASIQTSLTLQLFQPDLGGKLIRKGSWVQSAEKIRSISALRADHGNKLVPMSHHRPRVVATTPRVCVVSHGPRLITVIHEVQPLPLSNVLHEKHILDDRANTAILLFEGVRLATRGCDEPRDNLTHPVISDPLNVVDESHSLDMSSRELHLWQTTRQSLRVLGNALKFPALSDNTALPIQHRDCAVRATGDKSPDEGAHPSSVSRFPAFREVNRHAEPKQVMNAILRLAHKWNLVEHCSSWPQTSRTLLPDITTTARANGSSPQRCG